MSWTVSFLAAQETEGSEEESVKAEKKRRPTKKRLGKARKGRCIGGIDRLLSNVVIGLWDVRGLDPTQTATNTRMDGVFGLFCVLGTRD